MFVYAIEGIIAFTLAPLYAIVKLGIGLLILDVLAAIVFATLLAFKINLFNPVMIIVLVSALLTSLIIICLGVSSIYQAKIYSEVKNRPIYISKETNTK